MAVDRRSGGERGVDGFTLIELLIVIVILGVLSTVTVFAVRGISDQGATNSCAIEMKNLNTAEQQHWALHGRYAVEADLVANQVISSDSSMYDVTLAGQTFTIAPAPGSACTATTSGGDATAGPAGPAAPDRSSYAISLADLQTAGGGASSFGGHPSIEYNVGGGNHEILIFGRAEGELDFVDMVNAAPGTSRRLAFVHLDQFADTAELRDAMNVSRSTGFTTFALYPDDDPGNAIQTFLDTEVSGPNEELVLLDAIGGPHPTLLELMAAIG